MSKKYHGTVNYDNKGFKTQVIPSLERMNIPYKVVDVGNKGKRVQIRVKLTEDE